MGTFCAAKSVTLSSFLSCSPSCRSVGVSTCLLEGAEERHFGDWNYPWSLDVLAECAARLLKRPQHETLTGSDWDLSWGSDGGMVKKNVLHFLGEGRAGRAVTHLGDFHLMFDDTSHFGAKFRIPFWEGFGMYCLAGSMGPQQLERTHFQVMMLWTWFQSLVGPPTILMFTLCPSNTCNRRVKYMTAATVPICPNMIAEH